MSGQLMSRFMHCNPAGKCHSHPHHSQPSIAPASAPAMKVDPMRKRLTGRASFQEGIGAVFFEKCHQKEGLRIDMMLSCVMMVSAM